ANTSTTNGTTTVGADVTLTSDNNITITTPKLNLSSGAVISTSGASSTITIASPAGSDLTIQAPSNGSATVQAASTSFTVCCTDQFPPLGLPSSGSINIAAAANKALVFANSGNNQATINLNGSVIASTQNASTTIANGVTGASTGPIFMFVDNGTFDNKGTLMSTAPTAVGFAEDFRPGFAGTFNQITVGIVSRNGPLTLNGTSGQPGQVIAAGSGQGMVGPNLGPINAEIWIASYGRNTNIISSYTFTTGAAGGVLIEAKNAYQNNSLTLPAGAINVGDNVTVAVNGPTAPFPGFILQAPTLNLGDNAVLFSSKSSANTGLVIFSSADPGVPSPLTINLAGTAALNTGGSFVNINTNNNGVLALGQT